LYFSMHVGAGVVNTLKPGVVGPYNFQSILTAKPQIENSTNLPHLMITQDIGSEQVQESKSPPAKYPSPLPNTSASSVSAGMGMPTTVRDIISMGAVSMFNFHVSEQVVGRKLNVTA
jgi:hypothetical protein